MATVEEIGKDICALVAEQKYQEAVDKYYSPKIVSREPMGPSPVQTGLDAIKGKMEWWENTMETHGVEVDGPFVNGDQFVAEYKMDVTNKESGERTTMHETGVYTVEDGKIVDEKFFYKM